MKSVIYTVIAASVLQIVAVCFMSGYLYHRSNQEAAYFVALAQSHAEKQEGGYGVIQSIINMG